MWKQLQRTLALAAGISLLVPGTGWAEEGSASASSSVSAETKTAKPTPKGIVPDVVLTREGTFHGTLIDGEKKPLAKTKVALKRKGKLMTTAETNAEGEYSFTKLTTGAYQLEVLDQTVPVRAWKPNVAPEKALKQLDLAYIPDAEVVRAQFGYFDPVNTSILILGVAGVIIGGVAIAELESLEDDIQKLQSP